MGSEMCIRDRFYTIEFALIIVWQVRIVILTCGQKTFHLTLSRMDQFLLVQTSLIQAPSALFLLHYVSDYGLGFLGGGEILL